MDIYVHRTSTGVMGGSIRQFNSLNECINTLEEEAHNEEYVIRKVPSYLRDMAKDSEWIVEIYDDYRE